MTNRIWDGSSWKEYKNLKVYNGSSWKDAAKGWLFNGSSWRQWYPEYPVLVTAPTISGSSTQGNVLTVSDGSWKGFPSDKAFSYTSTSYQWLRNGSDISGANGNQYATVLADVGNAISCRVTVGNNRGTTPSTSSNSITVTSALPGAPSNLTLSNNTTTPGAFSVSTSSGSTTSATGSWTASTSATSYSASTSFGTISADTGARTFSISGGSSGSSYTVTITAFNSSGSVGLAWTAGSNATSYDIYVNGSYWTNTTSTSATYNWGTTGTISFNVRSRNSAGPETTGVSGSIAISAASRQSQATGSFYAVYPAISNLNVQSKTDTTATLNWNQSNQNSYSITTSPSTQTTSASGSTSTVTISGLTGSTTYTATVVITSSTGQQTSQSVSFTTNQTALQPAISSLFITNSSTLTYVNWAVNYQDTYSISVSPSTGGTGGGSSFSGTADADRQKYIGTHTAGTTYNISLTVTSSTGHSDTESISWTAPGGGGGAVAPSAPTNVTNSYATGPTWTGTWTASATGSTPITYYWTLNQANSNGGSITNTASGSTTSTTFTQSMNSTYGLWAYFTVYASNSAGNSSTVTSNWA